jgi:tRNA-dependent cyclodipeptide synthase
MTKSALAEVYDIHSFEKVSRDHIQQMWKPRIVSLTREEASQPDNTKRSYRILLTGVSNEQRSRFQSSKCLFLVSVGQNYHEGAKLEAALKCMNKHFKEIIILVGDTIQRYTHAVHQGKNPEELLAFAENEGSKWLERNEPIIKKVVTKPHEIFRWDRYRKHAKFGINYATIDSTSKSEDSEYKSAFDKDARIFLQRAIRSNAELAPNSTELCMQYLKEECACMCLWVEEGCEFLTYPYGINNSCRATYKKYIEQPYHGIMCEIAYDIKGKDILPKETLASYKEKNV